MKLITEISHNRFVVVINNDSIMTVTGCIILAKNSSYCAYKLAITASKINVSANAVSDNGQRQGK